MPKFRTHKVKHEHTIIPGLRPVLEQMAQCPDVHSLIPGPIRAHRSARGVHVTVQYETDTGLKLLGRNGSAIQEVFVVSSDPPAARQWLTEAGLAEDRSGADPPPDPVPAAGGGSRPAGKQVTLQFAQPCARCGRTIAAGSRAMRVGWGGGETYLHVRCAAPQ